MDDRRTTHVILEVVEKFKLKKAPKQVETLFVLPNGPKLKSSDEILYDCSIDPISECCSKELDSINDLRYHQTED